MALLVPHEACSLRSTWALTHSDSKRERHRELSTTLTIVKRKQMPVRHTRDHHREAEKVAYGDVGIKLRVSKEIYRHTVVTTQSVNVRRYGGQNFYDMRRPIP